MGTLMGLNFTSGLRSKLVITLYYGPLENSIGCSFPHILYGPVHIVSLVEAMRPLT